MASSDDNLRNAGPGQVVGDRRAINAATDNDGVGCCGQTHQSRRASVSRFRNALVFGFSGLPNTWSGGPDS